MPRKKKEIEVIDMGGVKTVAKKQSVITWTKRVITIVTIIWLALLAWFPLHVKNTYSQPIKKSIVVSMFFDLQKGIVKQYEALLDGVADSINLEKPISVAIDGVKLVERGVDKVTDTTAKAKETTDKATTATDDAAAKVNQQLDKIKKDLTRVAQAEVDKMLDSAIKTALDKQSGGLGTTLLTNYGIDHVYPWRPSSWPVATKIYDDLSKSDVTTITVITNTVDTYFGYVAWGLVFAVWGLGLYIWSLFFKKAKMILKPFNVCPRCGHTYADKRTALGLLKVLQPWTWF